MSGIARDSTVASLPSGDGVLRRTKRKGVTLVTHSLIWKKLLLFLVLALLVSDATAGLASGLARGLALTAATVLCALTKVASLDSLNMLHYKILQ